MTNTGDALRQGLVTRRAGIAYTNRVIQKVHGDAVDGLGFTGTLFARDIINQAVDAMGKTMALEMQLFAQAMSSKAARNRDGRVTRIHTLAGEAAVAATVRSYNRTKTKRRRAAVRAGDAFSTGVSLERRNRFANGKLGRALASPQMFDARWDGVSFINKDWLDRNAAQWYRLSFGAGPNGAGTPPHRNHNIKFFGENVFPMTLQGFGPSASFSMPAGIWFGFNESSPGVSGASGAVGNVRRSLGSSNGGGPDPSRTGLDQFVPGSFGGRAFAGRRTKGIQGTAYLDAGVQALTRELGRGWQLIMTEWFQEAAVQDTGPIASIGVSPEAAQQSATKLTRELAAMRLTVSNYKSRTLFDTVSRGA